MGWARRIAGLPCGRWSKWGVLVFWIAVFAAAGPLAGKLNSAQQNDASAWLPNNAESTQVVELAKRFTPSDIFPALVVYERPDGAVTPADQAKVAADVKAFAGVRDVTGEILGPIPAQDAERCRSSCRSRSPRRATAGRSSPPGSTRCGRSPGPMPAAWPST